MWIFVSWRCTFHDRKEFDIGTRSLREYMLAEGVCFMIGKIWYWYTLITWIFVGWKVYVSWWERVWYWYTLITWIFVSWKCMFPDRKEFDIGTRWLREYLLAEVECFMIGKNLVLVHVLLRENLLAEGVCFLIGKTLIFVHVDYVNIC